MGAASQLASDAMLYVGQLSPIMLILGGVAFADLVVLFLIRLVKAGKIKW